VTGQQADRRTAAARVRAVLARAGGERRGLRADNGACPGWYRLIGTPWFSVLVCCISRPGQDPHPHDHPWAVLWSRVVRGGFTERVWPDKRDPARACLRPRELWSQASLPRDAAHVITGVTRPAWVVAVTGRSCGTGNWGFWVPVSAPSPRARAVHWQLYLYGSQAPGYAAAGDSPSQRAEA
jgi:hypothetical protein